MDAEGGRGCLKILFRLTVYSVYIYCELLLRWTGDELVA